MWQTWSEAAGLQVQEGASRFFSQSSTARQALELFGAHLVDLMGVLSLQATILPVPHQKRARGNPKKGVTVL